MDIDGEMEQNVVGIIPSVHLVWCKYDPIGILFGDCY
jgi:hypothetical protein